MSALGLGKSRHPSVAGGAATLTLHFAMKISRATCAKKDHVERVSTQGRMFGLRISAGVETDDLPHSPSPDLDRLAFPGVRRLALVWNDALPQRNCCRISRPSPLPWMN